MVAPTPGCVRHFNILPNTVLPWDRDPRTKCLFPRSLFLSRPNEVLRGQDIYLVPAERPVLRPPLQAVTPANL